MFYELKSEKMKSELYGISTQFLLGSNILVAPVINENERKKKTYFPSNRFYSFYTGEIIGDTEKIISIDAPLSQLPLFFRAGFITPIQRPPKIMTINQLRRIPIELVVALDSSYRSSGIIIFDDGLCKDYILPIKHLICLLKRITLEWMLLVCKT